MRTRPSFGVILNAERVCVDNPHALIGVVIEIRMRDLCDTGQRLWIDTEVVILASYFNCTS